MTSSESPTRTFTEAARRTQIMAAAIATVNEIGYHRASLSAIARRAGVAKSAIVYYFSSKERLLLSVVDDVFTRLDDAIAPAVTAETEPMAQLRAHITAYFAYVDTHRAEVVAGIEIVVSHRADDGTPLYLAASEEDTRVLRGILTRGMDAGVFRRMPLPVATSLVEAVIDAWTTELQRDIHADLDIFADETIRFLLRGLSDSPSAGTANR